MIIIFLNFTATGVAKHPINALNDVNIDSKDTGRTLKASERIAYGQTASKGQFDFMAVLAWVSRKKYKTNCAGTVIAPKYILTAASCVVRKKKLYPPTHVFLGGTDLKSSKNFPERIKVAKVIVHDQYKGKASGGYDIAILELARNTSYSAVDLAAPNWLSWSGNPSANSSLTSIGWGKTENGKRSTNLLYTEMKMGTWGVSPCPNCKQHPCTVICQVGISKGNGAYTNACSGDSGGPLMIYGSSYDGKYSYQVGVVSFGPRKCEFKTGSASTSVAQLQSWINLNIDPSPVAGFKTIAYKSRDGTLLMTYDLCTCGSTRVYGAQKGNKGLFESQAWTFVPVFSSPGSYFIEAPVSYSRCRFSKASKLTPRREANYFLTSPEGSSNEMPSLEGKIISTEEGYSRQQWIIETTGGSTTIRSAGRSSDGGYSYLGMSINEQDNNSFSDIIMVSDIEASDNKFSISGYTSNFNPERTCSLFTSKNS